MVIRLHLIIKSFDVSWKKKCIYKVTETDEWANLNKACMKIDSKPFLWSHEK